jgi:hypothetical protein
MPASNVAESFIVLKGLVWGDCSCIQVCIVPAIGVGASFSFLLSQGKY